MYERFSLKLTKNEAFELLKLINDTMDNRNLNAQTIITLHDIAKKLTKSIAERS